MVISLLVSASTPLAVLSLFIAMPPASLLVRLLKVVAVVPLIVWPPPPLKLVVPAPGVNVPPLLVQLPVTLMVVAVPAAKVPAVGVRVPRIVSAAGRSPPRWEAPPLLTRQLLKVVLAVLPC